MTERLIEYKLAAGGVTEARKRAALAMQERRVAKRHDPNTSPDGKPYVTRFAGMVIAGMDTQGKPTGNALWVAKERDVKASDAAKEVQAKPEEYIPKPVEFAADSRTVKPEAQANGVQEK